MRVFRPRRFAPNRSAGRAQPQQHRPQEMPGPPPKHADCAPLSKGALVHLRPGPKPRRRSYASRHCRVRHALRRLGPAARLAFSDCRSARSPSDRSTRSPWHPATVGWREPGPRPDIPLHPNLARTRPESERQPRLANESCLIFEANESENLSPSMPRSDAREPIRNIFLSFAA